jgi:hypothetical protein
MAAQDSGSVDRKFAKKLLREAVSSGGEIRLDDLASRFPDADRYRDILPALRSLEEGGKGRFIVGRKQHPSRFICDPSQISTSNERERPNEQETVAGTSMQRASPATSDLKTYEFALRRGVIVQLRLPTDLSKSEAERLSQIILAMPFE